MPFTLSHAAAVLPAIRRDGTARGPLCVSALVAGSFAPDMTYFADSMLPGAMEFGDVTHAPVGLFTVDVLVTAALVGLWLLVREPLVALLPGGWQGRVYAVVRGARWRDVPVGPLLARFYVSAVIGALTHVVWDAFTHLDRWGTRLLPVLDETVAGFPLYLFAQYGSSAVALAGLAWFTASLLRRTPADQANPANPADPADPADAAGAAGGSAGAPPPGVPRLSVRTRRLSIGFIALCVLLGVVHRCLRWYDYWGRIETPLDIVPTACFGAGAGLAQGLILYGLAMRQRYGTGSGSRSGSGRQVSAAGPGPDRRTGRSRAGRSRRTSR
ncbi:DUF4184 family protein [Streptomyces sp. NPDC050504]|uniref:DUF4184 family protein n=1 Tax=Streptomyces sp. NPDC050504 TaxID=3365618 RepID=UPI00379723FD